MHEQLIPCMFQELPNLNGWQSFQDSGTPSRIWHSWMLHAVLVITVLCAAQLRAASVWDETLPDLQLQQVRVSAGSLNDAWTQISKMFMVRTILVVKAGSSYTEPFLFERQTCTVHDMLSALLSTYQSHTFIIDKTTGIGWFCPKDIA